MLIWLSVFIAILVSLLIFKLSGAILAQFLFSNKNLRKSVFVQVLTSLTLVTITYSCLKSSFQTIYSIPFFVILISTIWSMIKNYRLFSSSSIFWKIKDRKKIKFENLRKSQQHHKIFDEILKIFADSSGAGAESKTFRSRTI